MSSDQLLAVLFESIERLEGLLSTKDDRIATLEAELREWKSGSAGSTNRQRRWVRGVKPAKDQPNPNKNRPAGRKKGHKGSGRKKPDIIDAVENRRLESCPDCNGNRLKRRRDGPRSGTPRTMAHSGCEYF